MKFPSRSATEAALRHALQTSVVMFCMAATVLICLSLINLVRTGSLATITVHTVYSPQPVAEYAKTYVNPEAEYASDVTYSYGSTPWYRYWYSKPEDTSRAAALKLISGGYHAEAESIARGTRHGDFGEVVGPAFVPYRPLSQLPDHPLPTAFEKVIGE